MFAAGWFSRRVGLAVLPVVAVLAQGCAYVQHRGQDALDMFDIGVTVTKKPQFGLYANCPFLAPAGYGKVDGRFIGIGGGKVGSMEHHQDNVGLLVTGRENTTFGENNADGKKAKDVAPGGFVTDAVDRDEAYDPTCVHYLHLGWVGVTGNIHYAEIPDFFLGWAGIDIRRDDGKPRGHGTPEPTLEKPTERLPVPVLAKAEPRPQTAFCTRCGGRRFVDRWPPVPQSGRELGGPASERTWQGRWCACWQTEAPPATASITTTISQHAATAAWLLGSDTEVAHAAR